MKVNEIINTINMSTSERVELVLNSIFVNESDLRHALNGCVLYVKSCGYCEGAPVLQIIENAPYSVKISR